MMPDRTVAPEIRPFGKLTIPAETIETLDNGLTLHHLRGGDQPVCTLTIAFEGGASEKGEALGRLLLNMLCEQTARHSADEVSEIIDYNGARLSGQLMSHHSALKLFALTHRTADMLPLLLEMLSEPAFDSARLEVIKTKCIQNLQTMRMDTAVLADEAMAPLIWGADHPLAHRTAEEDYIAVTPDMLLRAHHAMVTPRRAHAFFSGLYDDALLDEVRAMLRCIPSFGEGTPVRLIDAEPAPIGSIVRVPFEESYQSALSLAIPTIGRSHPDYIPLRFSIIALGGYFGSRLMTNIREEKGLTYGISAMLLGELQGSYASIVAKCDKQFSATVLDEIASELRKLASDPPAGEELERLRIHASTDLARILDTPAGCMQHYQNIVFTGTPVNYFEQQLARIESLSSDTIAHMATTYLRPEALRTVIAGE